MRILQLKYVFLRHLKQLYSWLNLNKLILCHVETALLSQSIPIG